MSKKKTKTPKTKFEANWRFKTLEALEKSYWGQPTYPSHLVTTCHALRKKPLNNFTTEDLRIMIGQNIGLKYLIPLALETLQQNILAGGDFYDGDLLLAVLKSEQEYWLAEPDNWKLLVNLFHANTQLLETHDNIASIRNDWFAAFAKFETIHQ